MLISSDIPQTAPSSFCNSLPAAFRKRLLSLTRLVSSIRISRQIAVASNSQSNGNSDRLETRFHLGERRRIDFLIAGTQKGGTTALDAYLRNHPEICMASVKEAHFFDNERYFQPKQSNYHEYHSLFKPQRSHRILGEATPIYMYWKSAPARIRQYNSRMKIIIILRNPIERAYSHWYMEQGRNNDVSQFLGCSSV